MRLLKLEANGEFNLTNDITDPTTPYAILSHTWGEDYEEVTFEDLKDGSGNTKSGYKKLQFCGQQAARDGLQYFWVDTCCINKSRDSELSEAINSMFRWYHKAAICYVYLADVWTKDQIDPSLKPWAAAFGNSRWFTRGWTLQELIAPPLVEFFSLNGNCLGDKKSLEVELHKITGIPVLALQGRPLSDFSFDERVLWAQKRNTKREEDLAYSLLGIFDISIPVIYGEGKENAFRRLNREWKSRLDELSQATPIYTKRLGALLWGHSDHDVSPNGIVSVPIQSRMSNCDDDTLDMELLVARRRSEVAITRKYGACEKCRSKKIKCRHRESTKPFSSEVAVPGPETVQEMYPVYMLPWEALNKYLEGLFPDLAFTANYRQDHYILDIPRHLTNVG